ncbi:MAG TPA: carbamoyl-phosphate synthase large subunit, partial [Dehalococcoidia bacterium]|nr:carbamoyl-phosphate synthase large subunit [Dehalococcoidia bacterium]
PATIMTDEDVADFVYIEPLTVQVISRIIEREQPDALLPTLGGQTGLNLAVELVEAGVLEQYGVKLLGSSIDSIKKAEDRQLFRELLTDIGEPTPPSFVVNSYDEATEAKNTIGLPAIIRPAYTLGGTGGGIAEDDDSFNEIIKSGLSASPIHQVLVEKSIVGWKELEYEVMRDGSDNCITICNMENIDPMGVHTGDSIVVAPSQTLSDNEYQMLRTASLKIIRSLGIEGGCNVQFALVPGNVVAETLPDTERTGPSYYVIEVNPRVSRSSALASKATGYPIARVAAKIAIGMTLDEIQNAVTQKTVAAFEPALDYCVVKIPRWPFDKFPSGERTLGTQMKATGEVMAIDRTFEAAFQKAVRSLEITNRSIIWEDPLWFSDEESVLNKLPIYPNDQRLWALLAGLRRNVSADELSRRTGIDPWFTRSFSRIIAMEKTIESNNLSYDLLRKAKRLGFTDQRIGELVNQSAKDIRKLRKKLNIIPVYKMVDTCAAEFEAQTPYFYSTYETENEAEPLHGKKALVLGSGPI